MFVIAVRFCTRWETECHCRFIGKRYIALAGTNGIACFDTAQNRYKNDVVYEKHWGVTEDEKALPDVEGEEEKEGDGAASAEPRVVGGRTSNEVELREDLSRLEGQALQNSLRRDLSIMLEKRMEDVPV